MTSKKLKKQRYVEKIPASAREEPPINGKSKYSEDEISEEKNEEELEE